MAFSRLALGVAVIWALAVGSGPPSVARGDDDPGQAFLDQALEARLGAKDLLDRGRVIDLCQKALDAGLTGENAKFCKEILVSTLVERATVLSETVFAATPTDARGVQQLANLRQLALADLERVIKLQPKRADAHYYLGRLNALPGGDRAKAAAALDEAVKLAADNVRLHADVLVARATLNEPGEAALRDLSDAIKLVPNHLEAIRARAQVHLQLGKPDQALADLDAALEIDPEDQRLHALRGAVLASQKKFDEAIKAFSQAIELSPGSPSAQLERAKVYLILGKGEEALQDLNKVLAMVRTVPEILLMRANAYELLDDPDRALRDVEAALKLKPDMPAALRARAVLLAGSGRLAEAIGDLEALKKLNAQDTRTLTQLGYLYLSNKQHKLAAETFESVIKIDPAQASAYAGRADTYLHLGKHAEAVADFEQALRLQPENTHVLNNLAWLLATSPDDKVRNGKRAIELAELACKLTDHKEAHILSTLAAGYAETGDFQKAIEWSQKAVEKGEQDVVQQLKQELESYKAGRPWREKLQE
jgi:tetratricopeptide (TPR) repeat protein